MKRTVGIDFGLKRIGVAVSDPFGSFALPVGSVTSLENLLELVKQYDIQTFVVGLPLHLSGHESPMSLEARKFAELLQQKTNIPIEFIDERMSSKTAETLLSEQSMNRKKRQTHIDSLSATLILQTYLERISSLK